MRLLKTIRDEDLGIGSSTPSTFGERTAARAVVFDSENNVALLSVGKKKYHKLPGGGVEKGEDVKVALERELLEEIGCRAEVIGEIGIVEEYRNRDPYKADIGLHQFSECFMGRLVGEKGTPHLEENEIADGFEPQWLKLDEAIHTLQSELRVEDDQGKFITLRDLTFLQEANALVQSSAFSTN